MADTPAIIKERIIHWVQYVGITVVVFLLILGGGFVWRLVFKPKVATTSVGTVQSGGTVNITNKNNTRWIIPFVEGGAEARDNQKIGAYIRAGLRIEW